MDNSTLQYITNYIMQNPQNVVGFILPPIIDLVNKDVPEDNEKLRTIATFALCLLVTALFNFNSLTHFSLGNLVASFGIIFTESHGIYKLYFKNSYLRSKLLDVLYGDDDTPQTPAPTSVATPTSTQDTVG